MQDNPYYSSSQPHLGSPDDRMQPPASREKKPTVTTPPTQDQKHKPPLSFVLVRETTPICAASVSQSVCSMESSGAFQRTSMMSSPRASIPSAPSCGGSFRLQPRGRSALSPFSSASSRGRKRNAQCLSPCSATLQAGGAESTSSVDSPHTQEGEVQTHPAVEFAMESLSIRSPLVNRLPMDFAPATSSPLMVRPRVPSRSFMGSSFISYSSSPVGASAYLHPTGRGDSTGSGSSRFHSMSPASSAKSSPRFAPLTVLQQPGVGSTETPTKRPPRHGGPSSMMFSLDGSHHRDDDYKVEAPVTPPLPPTAVACSPPVSTTSSITKDFTPSRTSRNAHPSTPERTLTMESPGRMRLTPHMSSPSTPAGQSVRSAHDTPLPSIKLTPRRTPRSAMSNHNGSMQTTPHSAQELGLLPVDFVLDRSSERTFPGLYSSRHGGEDGISAHLVPPPPNPTRILPRTRPSYLPIPDWCDTEDTSPAQTYSYSPPRDHMRSERLFLDENMGGERVPHMQGTSLLAPLGNGGFMDAMISDQERAAAMDADGSLSDPDEDEPFILTNPAVLAGEGRQSFGPARQRQRLSYNSLDQTSPRASSMSLTSAYASNTSLLGVDFIRGDSMASLSRHPGNVSRNHSFKLDTPGRTEEEQNGPMLGFPSSRRQSDNSLSSIGLPLEPASEAQRDDGGRDLITPPPDRHDFAMYAPEEPPPRVERCGPASHTPPPRSVRFSSSNREAVNETIAMMAYQSGHNHKLSPQMECPS